MFIHKLTIARLLLIQSYIYFYAASSRIDQIESLEADIDILKSKLQADTHFLQSDGFLSQHEIEKMKSTLDAYHQRYCQHRDAVLKAAEFESPAYWRAQDVVSAIANTIEMMSPRKEST